MSAKQHGSGVLAPLFIWDTTEAEYWPNHEAERLTKKVIG